jgi:hypothetical protein
VGFEVLAGCANKVSHLLRYHAVDISYLMVIFEHLMRNLRLSRAVLTYFGITRRRHNPKDGYLRELPIMQLKQRIRSFRVSRKPDFPRCPSSLLLHSISNHQHSISGNLHKEIRKGAILLSQSKLKQLTLQ